MNGRSPSGSQVEQALKKPNMIRVILAIMKEGPKEPPTSTSSIDKMFNITDE